MFPRFKKRNLIKTAAALARQKTQVSPYVLEGLSDVEAPQGVITIARRPVWTWDTLLKRQRPDSISKHILLVLDGIQNAGNAATIVRTAEAAGAAGIITTPGSARLFSPRALRAAMGSSLRLPILEHQPIPLILEKCAAAHYGILVTAAPAKESFAYTEVDWSQAWAIVVGQEGNGLSAEWAGKTQCAVHIPMAAAVESLNVAAAAAILLYEAQRNNSSRHPEICNPGSICRWLISRIPANNPPG